MGGMRRTINGREGENSQLLSVDTTTDERDEISPISGEAAVQSMYYVFFGELRRGMSE